MTAVRDLSQCLTVIRQEASLGRQAPGQTGTGLPVWQQAQSCYLKCHGCRRQTVAGRCRASEELEALFHEYFNPETGQGLGAYHQTDWRALIARWLTNP